MTKWTAIGFLLGVSTINGFAGTMGPIEQASKDNYLSVFGGGGSLSRISMAQLGTAFYSEANGGPLAVNAFGQSNSKAEWLVGGIAGHAFTAQPMPYFSQWAINPTAELEGFYVGQNTLSGDDINNSTTRLTEHDFLIHYPLSAGVGLVNAVASFTYQSDARWHPYFGGGIGVATVSIANANSAQTTPSEPGINHYNSDPSDNDTTFATQAKVGLSFDYTEHLTVFAEYRYLYLSSTDFTFGSTTYSTHVATSNWNVKLGAQNYNLGVAGIKYYL